MKKQIKLTEESNINIEAFAKLKEDEFKGYIVNDLFESIIFINKHELRNCLSKHLKHVKGILNWITPFGILITIVAVFATSTFKATFGLSSGTWCAIFIIIGVMTGIWLILSILKDLRSKGIENIIEDIVAELEKSRK